MRTKASRAVLTLAAPRRHTTAPRAALRQSSADFVLPVFFIVIVGMVEIGRAIMVQELLTNASFAKGHGWPETTRSI